MKRRFQEKLFLLFMIKYSFDKILLVFELDTKTLAI